MAAWYVFPSSPIVKLMRTPPCRKIAPALAAGCSIIFKAAESTPLASLLFAKIFDTIG